MFDQRVNIFSIARRIGRPLILDGAMGSLLQQKYKSADSLWMSYLNIDNPAVVLKAHKKYINSGADIITTNTFRTNTVAVEQQKFDLSNLVARSVDIAKRAAETDPIIIAGSNPPAEDCYQKNRTVSYLKLELNHHKHIKLLYVNGVQFILNETQSHFDEIEIICKYCSLKNIPFVISLYFDDELKILSGEKLFDIIPFILKYAPLAIGFNCIKPETFLKLYKKSKLDFNWGVYFNCGSGSISDKNIECGISPSEYAEYVKTILKKQPSFIGACCGSSPDHIKEIKRMLDERN